MLNLKKIEYKAPFVVLDYTVQHAVGALPTVLEQDLQLRVHSETGAVHGELVFSDLSATGVEAARLKLAQWCERMGAALRASQLRQTTDVSLPIYQRARFLKEALLPYQRELYDSLVDRLGTVPEDEASALIAQCAADHHPLTMIPDAIAFACKEADERRGAPAEPADTLCGAQAETAPLLVSKDYPVEGGTLEVMGHREEGIYFDPPDGAIFAISDPGVARAVAAQLLAWADNKEGVASITPA